jgi:hypothetical protein
MQSRRRLFLLGGLILFLGTGVLIWDLTHPNPQIDRDHYVQIKDGMTLAEVEAIIGAPPGNYGGCNPNAYLTQACHGWVCHLFIGHGLRLTMTLDELEKELGEGRIVVWTGPQFAIAVHLDGQDRVIGSGLGGLDISFREPPLWERFWARLGIR